VFVEGARTEADYLTAWHREYRDTVTVTIDPFHGGPLQLVERAIATMEDERRDARRGRGRAHDEYWCMFDRDEHPNLPLAFGKALGAGVRVAYSNPCLELWFLLHFQDQSAYLERMDAQAKAKALLRCEKVLDDAAVKELLARHPEAVVRARALDTKHLGDGSPEGSNPSSSVWRLVESIRRTRPPPEVEPKGLRATPGRPPGRPRRTPRG